MEEKLVRLFAILLYLWLFFALRIFVFKKYKVKRYEVILFTITIIFSLSLYIYCEFFMDYAVAKKDDKVNYDVYAGQIESKIEYVSDKQLNIYFTDGKYYYTINGSYMTYNDECIANLVRAGTNKVVGCSFNIDEVEFEKLYLTDYGGSKILVWKKEINKINL